MRTRALVLPDDRPGLLAFLSAVQADGRTPLSENKSALVERADGRPGTGVVAELDGDIVGYVGLAPARSHGEWAMELVVAEDDKVVVADLVAAAVDRSRAEGATRLRWWAYDPQTQSLPTASGFEPERELLFMARKLPVDSPPAFDPNIEVSGFRPGVDEEAWLRANNAAFADHRENGAVTIEDLRRRMAMDWFDPAGLRMAWRGHDLAGFCWTKIHPDGEGEIYIIGVVPGFQGRGLGRALVLEGMSHLTDAGCARVFLYTDADNEKAMALYEGLGLVVERVHRAFIRAV